MTSPLFDRSVTAAGKTYPTLTKDIADYPERLTEVEATDADNADLFTTDKLKLTNGAAAEAIEVVATSDTPDLTWDGETAIPSAEPDGYLKIKVGSDFFYIPYWA